MKPIRFFQLLLAALTLTPHAPARAELVNYSWWDGRFGTPKILSAASGGYTRQARLPDEDDIILVISDSVTKTNTEAAGIRVTPPGTVVGNPTDPTARAQSDFGQNHAETRTTVTGFGESEGGQYFDVRHHVMMAESIWTDQWTFTGPGLGTSAVTLAAGFDVDISHSPCPGCLGVGNPVFTRSGLNPWWYRIYGSVRVFDLDVIDSLIQEDSDELLEVPRQVAAFEVVQQGSNEALDFYSIEPYGLVPNAQLAPIHTNGTASFVPVAGHRYAVAGQIHLQSRNGADVDAAHTFSLDKVILGQGLRLHSVATTNNGAQFNVLDATRLTITRTGGDVTLSFPSVTSFTYDVEFKDALNASAWTPLTTRAGNDSMQSVTDSFASGSVRFYRLHVQ